jgi:hypothetical protein
MVSPTQCLSLREILEFGTIDITAIALRALSSVGQVSSRIRAK